MCECNNYCRSCKSATSLPLTTYYQPRFQGGLDRGCGHVRRRSVSFSRDAYCNRRNGLDNDCGYQTSNNCVQMPFSSMNSCGESCNTCCIQPYGICCPAETCPCPCPGPYKEQKFSDIVTPAFLLKDCSKSCSCGDQCKPKLKPIECCVSREMVQCFCKLCQVECSPKPPCFLVLPMSSEPWENQKNNGQTQKKTGTALPRTEANRLNRRQSLSPATSLRPPAGAVGPSSSRRGSNNKKAKNVPSQKINYSSSDSSKTTGSVRKRNSQISNKDASNAKDSDKVEEDPNKVLTDNVMTAYADYKETCCDCSRYNPMRVCECYNETEGNEQNQQQQPCSGGPSSNEQQQQQQQASQLDCCMTYPSCQPQCCSYSPQSNNQELFDTNIDINDKNSNTEECGCSKGNCICVIKPSKTKKNEDNTGNNGKRDSGQERNNGCSTVCCPYYGYSCCYPPQCCMYHYYRWMRCGYCWPNFNYCCAPPMAQKQTQQQRQGQGQDQQNQGYQKCAPKYNGFDQMDQNYNAYTVQQQQNQQQRQQKNSPPPAAQKDTNAVDSKKSNQSIRKQGGGTLYNDYQANPMHTEFQFPTIYTGNPMGLKFEMNAPFMPWKKSCPCPSGGYVAYGNNHINTFSNA